MEMPLSVSNYYEYISDVISEIVYVSFDAMILRKILWMRSVRHYILKWTTFNPRLD